MSLFTQVDSSSDRPKSAYSDGISLHAHIASELSLGRPCLLCLSNANPHPVIASELLQHGDDVTNELEAQFPGIAAKVVIQWGAP